MKVEQLKGLVIAHRGLHQIKKGIPENSISAFDMAIKYKFPIELDIQLLKDGTPIVFHDDNLFRLTNVNKNVEDCNLASITNLTLLDTKEKIPTLEEVLKHIDGKVLLVLEIKYNKNCMKHINQIISLLEEYHHPFVIQSFHPKVLLYLKKKCPNILRGQLISSYQGQPFYKKWFMQSMIYNGLTKPHFLCVEQSFLSNKILRHYQQKGLPVLAYTIRSEKELKQAKRYADSFICEKIGKQ